MANLIRCKACGYVTKEGNIKDACPACGVPAKMFEPYTDPLSEKRRRIIDLHSHPIIVHFPQAFALTLFFLAVLFFIAPSQIKDDLCYTMKVLSFFLPFFVVLSFLTGLLDGKTRFRKVTTPFLKKKIIIGLIFFITSIALAALAFTKQFPSTPMLEYFTLLTIIAAGCTVSLGFIGGRLAEAKFPG
jgi:O-antigen/teichoic acid export membrane protein